MDHKAIVAALEAKLRDVNQPVYGNNQGSWRSLYKDEVAEAVIALWGEQGDMEQRQQVELLRWKQRAEESQEAMKQLAGELYQVLGALDASEKVLDQVSAAANGQALPYETLLPYIVEERATGHVDYNPTNPIAAQILKAQAAIAEWPDYLRKIYGVDSLPKPEDWLVHQTSTSGKAGCMCQGCGRVYHYDLSVPDDAWERIKPAGKAVGSGLLCPDCILSRLAEKSRDSWYLASTEVGENDHADDEDETVMPDSHSRTIDICDQLVRYGGCVGDENLLDALEAITDVNDGLKNSTHRLLVIADISKAVHSLHQLMQELQRGP